jgi:hypothetical protein
MVPNPYSVQAGRFDHPRPGGNPGPVQQLPPAVPERHVDTNTHQNSLLHQRLVCLTWKRLPHRELIKGWRFELHEPIAR